MCGVRGGFVDGQGAVAVTRAAGQCGKSQMRGGGVGDGIGEHLGRRGASRHAGGEGGEMVRIYGGCAAGQGGQGPYKYAKRCQKGLRQTSSACRSCRESWCASLSKAFVADHAIAPFRVLYNETCEIESYCTT